MLANTLELQGPATPTAASLGGMRTLPEFDNHEMVIAFSDAAADLKGFIAIHSTKLGPALGGTRCLGYKDEHSALVDALNLSKAMSFKCALANLPFGGGKAVIIQNGTANSTELLHAYARVVDNLRGLFKTGTDVGVTDADVQVMGQVTSHMLGLSDGDRDGLSTGSVAALGTYYSIKAAFEHAAGSSELKGRRIGVKGLGKLGSELVRLLLQDGVTVVAADIDSAKGERLKQQHPEVSILSPDVIHKEELDLYAPCALGNEFNTETISELRTHLVAGGANNQLANEEAGDELHARGITYAPDYIVNAGGLIYVADELETDGFQRERVLSRTKAIKDTLLEIFQHAAEENRPTHRVANDIGLARMNRES